MSNVRESLIRFINTFGMCNDRFASLILRAKDRLRNERICPPSIDSCNSMSTDEAFASLERHFASVDDLRTEQMDTLINGVRALEEEAAAAKAEVERLRPFADLVRYERHPLSDASVRAKVWALTDGHCAYCGNQLEPDKSNGHAVAFCVEHVVPRAAGGPDNIANYVPSCLGCNSVKGDRHVLTFIRGALARRTALTVVSGDAA